MNHISILNDLSSDLTRSLFHTSRYIITPVTRTLKRNEKLVENSSEILIKGKKFMVRVGREFELSEFELSRFYCSLILSRSG